MERRITEESITKCILSWLVSLGWQIISFDFPQSGTGKVLHPNDREGQKNKDTIIPDIVCLKDQKVLIIENKNRFVLDDFIKIEKFKNYNDYSDSISELIGSKKFDIVYYGVGLPIDESNKDLVVKNVSKVDFIINCDSHSLEIFHQGVKGIL